MKIVGYPFALPVLASFLISSSVVTTPSVSAQSPGVTPPPAKGAPANLPPGGQPTQVKARPGADRARAYAPTGKPAAQSERFQRANVSEFDQLRTRPDAVVVDVRTSEEFQAGHIPKAGLVDIKTKEFLGTIAGLDRSKLYLINCAAGVRSVRACQAFAALGFTNLVNLDGGYQEWQKSHASDISKAPPVELPKSPTPIVQRRGTASTAPAAQPAPTNLSPKFKSPVIIKQTPNK